MLLLAIVLLLSLKYRRTPTDWRLAPLLGLSLGLLALDRGELVVLGLALCVPAVLSAARSGPHPVATSLRGVAVVGIIAIAVVTPWTVYNQERFHQTVLISNDLGQTLVGANCQQSYYGSLLGYDGNTCFYAVLHREQLAQPNHPNEAQADVWFRNEAVTFALRHWQRWPEVAVFRELWLWSLWRPGWTVFMSGVYLGRPQWIAWSQIVAFWLLTPFAAYGLVVARRRKVRRAELVTMVVFTALLGLLVVGHLRYRVPAEMAWVLLGAIAIDRLAFGRDPASRAAAPVSVGVGDLG